jgi:hypothetical protein
MTQNTKICNRNLSNAAVKKEGPQIAVRKKQPYFRSLMYRQAASAATAPSATAVVSCRTNFERQSPAT